MKKQKNITAKRNKFISIKMFLGFLLIFVFQTGYSQQDTLSAKDLLSMSFAELLDIEISVASKKAMTQRESPAIVSVITQTDIQNSGARDMVDVLRLVPGIEFGIDVQGTVGLSMRGNWGHEGKVLLMIDGQEFNELCYSTVVYGNHFPVDNIKRIEIIRGPGSSIYGGFAELGVINIITENSEDINGVKAVVNYGHTGESGRSNVGLSAGKKIDDFEFSLSGFYSDGNRSDRDYTDVFGDTYSMKDNSDLTSLMINTGLKYKDLSIRFIYDDYKVKSRDFFYTNASKAYSYNFVSMLGEIKYDWKVNDKLTLTPKFNYISSSPWTSLDECAPGDNMYFNFNRTITKLRPSLTALYDINDDFNIIAGAEYTEETGKISSDDWLGPYYDSKDELSFGNFAAFAQGIIQTDFVNMTVGIRADIHSEFGAAFAPRIGFTKAFDKFHAKLLYSMAFRSPGIENVNNAFLNADGEPDIEPEKTQVFEIEAGYKLTKNMLLTANVYYINIDNTIVYFIDGSGILGYKNVDVSGTEGFDLEYKLKQKWGYINLSYSFYSAKGINKVPDYQVPNEEAPMLGTPQHKVTLNSSFNLYKGLSLNPSLAYLGKRYAYTTYDPASFDVVLKEMDAIMLLNVFINYRDLGVEGLNLGIGAYNLLNADYDYIQPYNGWHAPYPGKGMEFIIKLSYNFKFD